MLKKFVAGLLLLCSAQVLANEVNVYSAREEQLIKPLLDAFSQDTGIKVNLVTGDDDPLLERLKREGANSPADVLIMADAGRLYRAAAAGSLQAIHSATLEQAIPANLRDPGKQWFGLTSRARVLFYNPATVQAAELSSYEDLADPKWRGRICVRSSNSIYNQSLLASIIAAHGAAQAEQWAQGLAANLARPPSGGDRDQIKAVAAGQCDIAIANTYYYAQMLYGSDASQKAAASKVKLLFPNQRDRGTHINISGAGVTKSAKNRENAIKLLEYMVLDDAQRWYSTTNGEYPAKRGIAASPQLQSWGNFKSDALNLVALGKNNAQAVQIMDKAGWR
ncbi:Fe(3+) ABC transporter substrate-binding protein [Candidatus Thiothrix sp. Deng01]|uniref:Fe(3+) ABC transporter substrate-binding protein n=1 Tax=Candidatus Thiothrix phosphatis TaxID=3112415 RepID=A0ABU6CYL9_9GAMM|nr:Fe(3+) ABC transporter substrate-binding protein [Candidatus Thiothrix sp. Deng01]MEB4591636.1 Fe(3+) ABC transporter substrate-binding protein [Candidatus Thiothrix sp. Deng01]